MWNVVGHSEAVQTLTRSLQAGTPGHAYLITGPPQVGKQALAVDFAMALNCEQLEAGTPCGVCRSCQRIAGGKHSDILIVGVEADAETTRKNISIDQVRDIGRFVSLEPFEGRRRVVIIDGAEAMSLAAANAFLKTLEEPPAAVTLILLADHEESLLDTIRSRCHRMALSPLPRQVVASALVERWSASPERADLLSRLARGRMGWAVQALHDESILANRADTLEAIHHLSAASRVDRFSYAAELATRFGKDRQSVFTTLDLWREWWRDVLLTSAGAGATAANGDDLSAIVETAAGVSLAAVVQFLEAMERTYTYLQQNVNPRLALEVLFLTLPAIAAPDRHSKRSVALGA